MNDDSNAIFNCEDLARYICKKYNQKYGKEISEIKLQKSLYFLFACWGGFITKNRTKDVEEKYNYSSYLFNDEIQAWVYGPVLPKIYHLRKEGKLNYQNLDEEKMFGGKEFVKETIDSLLEDLFEISDFKLVSLSHDDYSWKNKFDISSERHNNKMELDKIIEEYANREAI